MLNVCFYFKYVCNPISVIIDRIHTMNTHFRDSIIENRDCLVVTNQPCENMDVNLSFEVFSVIFFIYLALLMDLIGIRGSRLHYVVNFFLLMIANGHSIDLGWKKYMYQTMKTICTQYSLCPASTLLTELESVVVMEYLMEIFNRDTSEVVIVLKKQQHNGMFNV